MPSALDRNDIGTPHDARAMGSFALALLIHAALIAALTWGVNWRHTDNAAALVAELWPSLPQEAKAQANTRPTEALPLPKAQQPALQAPPEPTPQADIALAQEKKRKQLKEQQLAQDNAKRDKAKALQAQTSKAEQEKAAALKAQKLQQAADKQRDENMKRISDILAKADGNPQGNSTSRATAGGKGSSRTYSAIARAAVIPNVVFTEAFDGNPLAKVEVRLQSDGTIISSRVVQPSGNTNWDKAVLNAVQRTRVMPKDVDGTLPDTILILEFKPRF